MRKMVWWDAGTQMKVEKIQKKVKGASASKIIRKSIEMVTFDDMVKALKEDMKHAKFINLKNY